MGTSIQQDETGVTERVFYFSDNLRQVARVGVIQHVALLTAAVLGVVVISSIVEVLIGAALLWHLHHLAACIRLNEAGTSRRILWWWDLWRWEEFTQGRVQFGKYAYSYRFFNRRLRGTLRLDQLNDADMEVVNRHIRERLVLPIIIAPDETDFCTSLLIGKYVRMSVEGLTIRSFLRKTVIPWSEIDVTICRLESDRPDFQHLWLKVQDQYLILEQKLFERTWLGGSAEEIAAVLTRYIDASQVWEFTLHGTPRSIEELDSRWEYVKVKEKERDESRSALLILSAMTLILFLVMLWNGQFLIASSIAFGTFSLYTLYRAEVMRVRKRQHDYETQREQLLRVNAET